MCIRDRDQVEQLTSSIIGARENVQYCKCCCTLTDREILSLIHISEVVGSNPVASTTHRKSETDWFSGFLFAILVVMQQQDVYKRQGP